MKLSKTTSVKKNIFDLSSQTILKNVGAGNNSSSMPQILFVASFPPRECGIATYTEDLIKALNDKFENSFQIAVCALENDAEKHEYPKRVKYVLNTQNKEAYNTLANNINNDNQIKLVVFQHEFGFYAENAADFISLLKSVNKTKITVFHTVLPRVDETFKKNVQEIAEYSDEILVMTQSSSSILSDEYGIDEEKISVIAHGTHLVAHTDKHFLKEKYGFSNRKILSTFGLLSSGKSIETTLDALTTVVNTKPDVLFLIIGKTHPGVVKNEGEKYREFLEEKVRTLKLEKNVKFINKYVKLDELLEYLQLTDIYLFTSKDPNQAVSGTFSYAASCGCAIISTPIPHAAEFLSDDCGIVIDFQNSKQMSEAINRLLFDIQLRNNLKLNGLHKIVSTAWENSAIAHASLFSKISDEAITLNYKKPVVNLDHIKRLTTRFGMIQFAKINQPDVESGYTIDDNARAMIAMCQNYEVSKEAFNLRFIEIYLNFIDFCQQPDGRFLNYVDSNRVFSDQNIDCNLEDANGRAIWALGFLTSYAGTLPSNMIARAEGILEKAFPNLEDIHSPRAMAFIIKGLYYYNLNNKSRAVKLLIKKLADRLTQMYLHVSTRDWEWFEGSLTYGNSILPEALLFAYRETGESTYKEVAKKTFDFLLSQTFDRKEIKVISNRSWLIKGGQRAAFGEQPIDVAYTVLALKHFYETFKEESYAEKMNNAFEWFLGRNHLNQIIYNPCTGGCYDGLEEHSVNLNQGAESCVSYLMARLTFENLESPIETAPEKVFKTIQSSPTQKYIKH